MVSRDTDELSALFDALASEHRRAIIYALALGPKSISQLANLRGLSLPAIHKHIRVLEVAAMIRRRKSGRTNYLALERKPLMLIQSWVDQFHPDWGSETESLETYLTYLSKTPTMTKEQT